MEDLVRLKCIPCEGGLDPLTRKEFSIYLDQVSDWTVIDNDTRIQREFTFKDFKEALDFVNAAGEIAEEEGHHPNICIHSWNKVKMTLYTHAINGLSENDFILAAKIDAINK
jgi:4a-hydroxytetrahydrobiopterin dehydratase